MPQSAAYTRSARRQPRRGPLACGGVDRRHQASRVERSARLHLTPFGLDSLESEARRQRLALATLLRHAIQYYLAERRSGRLAGRVPPFARQEAGGGEISVAVELEGSEWRRIEEAAALERVSVPALVRHAAMLYLADIDSGKLASRLVGRTRPDRA